MQMGTATVAARRAMHFVLLVGVLSFFADFTYESARSVLGPWLATMGATATVIGIVTGFGELLGYRLACDLGASGRRDTSFLADHDSWLCGADERCSVAGPDTHLAERGVSRHP
ncbi:MAG: hypothetical protein RXR20_31300 [Paraburkholderia sp.]